MHQLVGTYTVKRKTRRWPFALFCNIIDISGVNAYVLWLEIIPSWNSNKLFRRSLFLETLGTLLVNDEIIRRLQLPMGNASRLLVNDAMTMFYRWNQHAKHQMLVNLNYLRVLDAICMC